MRLLFITNFYPPYTIGGMELRCQEVVNYLKKQGHEVLVLTSIYGNRTPSCKADRVHRVLYLEADMVHYRPSAFFISRQYEEHANLEMLRTITESFAPDIIFVWGMWNLSKKLLAFIEHHTSAKVVYSLASDWPAQPNLHESYWNSPAHHWLTKPLKYVVGKKALRILRKENAAVNLEFRNVICVSNSLRDHLLMANIPLKNVQVIYPGIDIKQFCYQRNSMDQGNGKKCLSLLYAGALVHHKGIHTAIEALALLRKTRPDMLFRFTVLGSGNPDYEYRLKHLVERTNLQNFVQFTPKIPRQEMAGMLTKFDILIFPSIWEEPFSRVILEAMAAGLVVVGTRTGGTTEILMDKLNGLTFEPEDNVSLAHCIERLFDDPELLRTLASKGHQDVMKQYEIQQMYEKIERYLLNVISSC